MMETLEAVMVAQVLARLNQDMNALDLHVMELPTCVLNLLLANPCANSCAVMDHFSHQMVNSVMMVTQPQEMDAQVLVRLK